MYLPASSYWLEFVPRRPCLETGSSWFYHLRMTLDWDKHLDLLFISRSLWGAGVIHNLGFWRKIDLLCCRIRKLQTTRWSCWANIIRITFTWKDSKPAIMDPKDKPRGAHAFWMLIYNLLFGCSLATSSLHVAAAVRGRTVTKANQKFWRS